MLDTRNTCPDAQIQIQTPEYKSRNPAYKSRQPKYKSRHPTCKSRHQNCKSRHPKHFRLTFWPRYSFWRNDLGNGVKVQDMLTLKPAISTEFRSDSHCDRQIVWRPHVCKALHGCIRTHSQTPIHLHDLNDPKILGRTFRAEQNRLRQPGIPHQAYSRQRRQAG